MGTNSLNLMGLNSPVINPMSNIQSGITMNTGGMGLYNQSQPIQPAALNLLGGGVSTASTSPSLNPTLIGGAVSLPY
jgi:hypothetical protein